jgi:hypothetical protein
LKVSDDGQSKRFGRSEDRQNLRAAFEEASAAIRAFGLGVIAATAAIAWHLVMLRLVAVWPGALIPSDAGARIHSLPGQHRVHRRSGQRESYEKCD